MKTEVIPGRTYYRPSGSVNWTGLIRWLVVPFGLAAALAWLMFWLFRVGHYYIAIVPAVAAVAVAACLKLAVNQGHCRSRLVAAAAGLCAGAILYLGYYYFGMVYHLGPGASGRLDLLPSYIRARMHLDVLRDGHDSRRDEMPDKGNVYANWGVFAFESLLILAITTGAAARRAGKPYCETCRKWMLREATHFEPARAGELLDAFRHGSARSLAALARQPVFATVPSTMLAIDFCPSLKDGTARDCPSWVSLKNAAKAAPGGTALDPFDSVPGKVLLRALALNSDEMAALAPRFEVWGTATGRAVVQAFGTGDRAGLDGAQASEAPSVDIRPLGADDAGRVLTKRNALIGNAFAFAALLLLFGAIGLAAWGGITAFPDDKSTRTVSPEAKAVGIAALATGGLLFVGIAVFFFANPTYLGNRFLLKVVKREFARRTGCLVDPTDPEAVFVEIVPKLNWGKLALESASDVGFLRADKARRQLLFEGDKERWRIPAAAILSCDVDFFVEGQGTAAARKIYYTVLRARHPTRFWETPIRERAGTGLFQSGRRKKAAEQLCAAIQKLQGKVPESRPPLASK